MSIEPVFMLLISINVNAGGSRRIRFFIPAPIFWVNGIIEGLADLASFVNILTFGLLKANMSGGRHHGMTYSLSTGVRMLYAFSDFFTELLLRTGRFDLVNVSVGDKGSAAKVRISVV